MNTEEPTSYASKPVDASESELSNTRSSNFPRVLIQALVFSALTVSGVALLAIVAFAELDWFLPTLCYTFAAYVGWQKFFVTSSSDAQQGAPADHLASASLRQDGG